MEACLTVLRGREGDFAVSEPAYTPPNLELFRIPAALMRMRARLAALSGPAPLEAFLPRMPEQVRDRERVAKAAVSSTLVAALEVTRAGEATVEQTESFGLIRLMPRSVETDE